jgi:NhaB family Na+:H+ antiporter
MISDNVFVATIYVNELAAQFEACNISRSEFDLLAVAVNSGTNVLSVATPNGQAAFLFLLTSSIAPKLNLTYFRMVCSFCFVRFPVLHSVSSFCHVLS